MDKQFILEYLEPKHLEEHPKLKEICDASGIETVKQLLLDYEQEQFYIPRIGALKALMHDVVQANREMPEKSLRNKTGLSKKIIQSIIWNIKKKSS
jgi:hypothetical protein